MVDPVRLTAEQKRLVEVNYPLAKFLARIAWDKNREQMDLEEVTSVAFQGLVTAAIKYDPVGQGMSQETIDNGKAFSAWARLKIVNTIIDWQRSNDHVQRSLRADYKALVKAGFTGSLNQAPGVVILAERSGLSEVRVRAVVSAVQLFPISTEELSVEEPDRGTIRHDVESSAVEVSIKSVVAETLQALPPLQQLIVVLRYYSGYELQTIAAQLQLNLGVVREAHSEAVLALHAAMMHKVRDTH